MPDSSWIETYGLVAILRGDYVGHVMSLIDAMYEGGIRMVEVTMNSADALGIIKEINVTYGDKMWVGAGTVLTTDEVKAVAKAGGQYIVSPDTFAPVIEETLKLGLTPMPGAYTASEVRTALRAGAHYIKLFPAMPAGPSYLKQLRAPLDNAAFITTGGIDASNLGAFIKAGAVGIGIGSALAPKTFNGTAQEIETIKAKAQALVAAFEQATAE